MLPTKTQRRNRYKAALIILHGSKCKKCGYNKNQKSLTFHHRDPTTKEFELGKSDKNFIAQYKESLKCHLLCRNCHGELH